MPDQPFKIDIHTHILPPDWPNLKERYGYGGFVQLERHGPGCAHMLLDGKFFREVGANCWDSGIRVREYDPHDENFSAVLRSERDKRLSLLSSLKEPPPRPIARAIMPPSPVRSPESEHHLDDLSEDIIEAAMKLMDLVLAQRRTIKSLRDCVNSFEDNSHNF